MSLGRGRRYSWFTPSASVEEVYCCVNWRLIKLIGAKYLRYAFTLGSYLMSLHLDRFASDKLAPVVWRNSRMTWSHYSFLLLKQFNAMVGWQQLKLVEGVTLNQCGQMLRLFFNIWPFAIMKISPIMPKICPRQLSILPNNKWTVKNLPKTGKLLPKWRKFDKSGHTALNPEATLLRRRQTLLRRKILPFRPPQFGNGVTRRDVTWRHFTRFLR